MYRIAHKPHKETTPEMDLIIATYERAARDLKLSDPKLRRRARYRLPYPPWGDFWQREGIPWRAVRDGKRSVEWLRR